MKSTIRKSTFMAMYRLLDRVSPVDFDCGKLCGCACCVPERSEYTDDLGIYLLPGEEKIFTGNEDWITWNYDYAEDYEFPDSWSGKVWFLSCNTPPVCDRKKRPLQCRTYPVAPHILQFDSDRKNDRASEKYEARQSSAVDRDPVDFFGSIESLRTQPFGQTTLQQYPKAPGTRQSESAC